MARCTWAAVRMTHVHLDLRRLQYFWGEAGQASISREKVGWLLLRSGNMTCDGARCRFRCGNLRRASPSRHHRPFTLRAYY